MIAGVYYQAWKNTILVRKQKLHWLKIGDGNNKQFHRAAKTREVRNSIRELKKDDGTIVKTQEDIKAEAVGYFHRFLTHKPGDFTGVSKEKLQDLLGYECAEVDKVRWFRKLRKKRSEGYCS